MQMNSGDLDDDELEQIKRYQDFTTIDWIQDSIVERNRRLRHARQTRVSARRGPKGEVTLPWLWYQVRRIVGASQSWFIISLVGICIGVNAALISIVTEWLSDIKMGYCSDGWWLNQQFCCWEIESDEEVACPSWHPWSQYAMARWSIYVLFAAILAFIASHLVRSMAKYAAGSGISEIKCILAGFVMHGFLGLSTFLIKSITLPLVIASGLSVGKEGPSVHMACCIGNLVAGLFTKFSRSQGKRREVLTAASAAGVAVAFGSPIGGVLFSIEEMSHTFNIKTMWRSFFCALVATVTLSAMNPFRTGKLVLFQVTYDRDWHFFEIIFFIIIGIFGGLYGAVVVKLNLQVAAFRRSHLAKHGIAEAVALAILTAVIGYPNRFLRIDMTESMAILFRECESGGDYDNLCQTSVQWRMVNSLLLATIIRIGLVIISYGAKVPAGIFVPSMAIGASFGRMLGIMVKAMYRAYPQSGIFAYCQPDVPCITPGTYAFLGAAAALSGVMRITVTVVVIMFELTGALTYILPTMIVLLVTKAVGDFLGVRGIADEMIRFNGFPFLEKEDHAFNASVSSVMRKDLATLNATGMSVRDVEAKLANSDCKGFPIISADDKRTLLGFIDRAEVRYVLEKTRKMKDIPPYALCSFIAPESNSTDQALASADEEGTLLADVSCPAIGADEDISLGIIETTATSSTVQLWPWVNQTPLSVSPHLPLEIVMQLFKRMGPRVILVEDHGRLVGLVTVKDVLRFTVTEQSGGRSRWADGDTSLDEAWEWARNAGQTSVSWIRRLTRQ